MKIPSIGLLPLDNGRRGWFSQILVLCAFNLYTGMVVFRPSPYTNKKSIIHIIATWLRCLLEVFDLKRLKKEIQSQ